MCTYLVTQVVENGPLTVAYDFNTVKYGGMNGATSTDIRLRDSNGPIRWLLRYSYSFDRKR